MTSARSAQGSWIGSRGDGSPARIRLIEASVRSRCACHSACAIGSLVATRIGQRGRRAVANAGAAVEPAERLCAGRPAEAARQQRAQRSTTNRPIPTARARNGSASHNPAQDTTREQSDDAQKAGQSAASRAPTRSRIGPAAGPASVAAARRHPARARAVWDRGRRRSTKLSGLPTKPSTAAAMRHPSRGFPHRNSHNTKA